MKSSFITFFAVLSVASIFSLASAQGNPNSANFLLSGCRDIQNPDSDASYKEGFCSGAIWALAHSLPGVCTPQGVAIPQVGAVVVRYIEQAPQRWHENFMALASEALRKTWPCR
ncbi:Rap1a/Tai family immunity protein [Pseudoroseomonas wenyumeiae]